MLPASLRHDCSSTSNTFVVPIGRRSSMSHSRRPTASGKSSRVRPVKSPSMCISTAATTSCGLPSRSGTSSSRRTRSEEHTSELQSLAYLVCRLLLEKKKKQKPHPSARNPTGKLTPRTEIRPISRKKLQIQPPPRSLLVCAAVTLQLPLPDPEGRDGVAE